MEKKKMLDALTVAFEKAKNSCVKRNYIDTVNSLNEKEYSEVEWFYLDALKRWS